MQHVRNSPYLGSKLITVYKIIWLTLKPRALKLIDWGYYAVYEWGSALQTKMDYVKSTNPKLVSVLLVQLQSLIQN